MTSASSAPLAPAPVNAARLRKGIVIMCAATLVFSILNAAAKYLLEKYPINELVFFRSAFTILPVLWLAQRDGHGFASLRTRRLGAHAWRGVLGVLSMGAQIVALAMLPISDVTAFIFTAPLFITALSVPLLGERVGVHRWSAVVIGFLGVLVMVQPGAGGISAGGLVAVGGSAAYALAVITIRQMSGSEPAATIVFYNAFVGMVVAAVSLPFRWQTPDLVDLAVLMVIGIGGGFAQFWQTSAYHLAPVAVVAPFSYSSLLWATILGFAIWDEVPTHEVLMGSILVVASGLYILYRETHLKKLRAAAAE